MKKRKKEKRGQGKYKVIYTCNLRVYNSNSNNHNNNSRHDNNIANQLHHTCLLA